jgi:integrase
VAGATDRALLLIGFAAALRRSELVALQVEDVARVGGGLRLRIARGKTDQARQGAEIGLPRGKHAETCPVLAFDAWQEVAKRRAGPLFRRISTGGGIADVALHPDAVRRILNYRIRQAGLSVDGFDRMSTHALRVGFITEAYGKGVRDGPSAPGSHAGQAAAGAASTGRAHGRRLWVFHTGLRAGGSDGPARCVLASAALPAAAAIAGLSRHGRQHGRAGDSPGGGGAPSRTRRLQRTAGVAAQPGAGAPD